MAFKKFVNPTKVDFNIIENEIKESLKANIKHQNQIF